MGLMDRDYLHEKHRHRPFSPPPERSGTSTLLIVLVFVAALFALYKLAEWKLDQRAAEIAAGRATAPAKPASRREEQPAPPLPSPPIPERSSETAAATRIVTKCVVNGKTSYGDGACGQGAKSIQVTTRSDLNLMAPVRPTASPPIEEPAPEPTPAAQITAAPNPAAKKAECEYLNAEIARLDSMARQPQGMQMQDWIKEQRKQLRDRQFRIRCS